MGIRDRIEGLRSGRDPYVVGRLKSGWACLAETQPVEGHLGYCVLFADPLVKDFNALSFEMRAQWGMDCALVGDALIETLGALRVNYETWGNLDPLLHTHITPRFSTESDEKRVLPPRQAYDWARGPHLDLDSSRVQDLLVKLRRYLARSL